MSPIVENFLGKADRFRKDPLALSSGEDLVLARDRKLWVEYAPFDYIRPDARVVIVGITPGQHQAQLAVRHLRKLLADNIPLEQAMAATKEAASFSGPMRQHLLSLLDFAGVPRIAGMDRAEDIFKADAPVHFTSMLRYPVFQHDPKKPDRCGNYNGRSRKPLSVPMLREMIDTCLTEEAKALPDAIWIALGDVVPDGLAYLVDKGVLRDEQVISGLPHPSGANIERISYFIGHKTADSLSKKVNPRKMDAARAAVFSGIARAGDAGLF